MDWVHNEEDVSWDIWTCSSLWRKLINPSYILSRCICCFFKLGKKNKKKNSNISVIAHWAITPSTMAPAAWTCLISIRNAYSSASLWSTKHYDNIRAKPRKTLWELFVWLMLSATSLRGSATWVCQWSAHCTLYSLCCLWITWSV